MNDLKGEGKPKNREEKEKEEKKGNEKVEKKDLDINKRDWEGRRSKWRGFERWGVFREVWRKKGRKNSGIRVEKKARKRES